MSPKSSSLALDEIKGQIHDVDFEFEPELEVLVKKRYVMDSDSNVSTEPVKIRGRITVSF